MLLAAACLVPLLLAQTPSAPAAPPQPVAGPPDTTSPQPLAIPPGTSGSSSASADGARIAEEQARAAQAQARQAQQRAERLEAEMVAIQSQMDAERQRRAALEQQLAEERSRREEEARAPAVRDRQLNAASEELARAGQTLATGSADVSDALGQAQALAAEVARSAASTGSPQESALAIEAQRLLGASQEALQRGDLFQARQALDAAARAAGQARGLAAAGTGTAATRPGY